MLLQNGDSLLTATLSPSELSSVGVLKAVNVQNELNVSPNPINTSATVTFKVAQSGKAALRVYDINGRQVALLFDGMAESGTTRQVHFDAAHLPAGMYIAILQTAGGNAKQKLILNR